MESRPHAGDDLAQRESFGPAEKAGRGAKEPAWRRTTPWLTGLLLLAYACASAWVMQRYAVPALESVSQIRLGADSDVYWEEARVDVAASDMVRVGRNTLGPVFLARATGFSPWGVWGANLTLLLASWWLFAAAAPGRRLALTALFLANPLIFMSVVTLGKEIFVLAGMALFVQYVRTRNLTWLAASLGVSFLGRWHQVVVFVAFAVTLRLFGATPRARRGAVLALVLVISAAFPAFLSKNVVSEVTIADSELQRSQAEKALGAVERIAALEQKYLFFATVVPKTLFNWVGNLGRVRDVVAGQGGDAYNAIGILGHQYCMAFTLGAVLVRRRFRLSSDWIFLAVFYSVVFAVSPSIQYRYYLPVYPLLLLEAIRPRRAASDMPS